MSAALPSAAEHNARTLAAAEAYLSQGLFTLALHGIDNDGSCTCVAGTKCKSPGKHPVARRWQAQTEPDLSVWAKRMTRLNVGIATGSKSGDLVVIDPDSAPALAALKALGTLPRTYCVKTPRGWHLYYRLPAGVRLGNGRGKLPPGIDVRADGGQVVAPPSRTPHGEYVVVASEPIAPIPAWLLALLPQAGQERGAAESTPLPVSTGTQPAATAPARYAPYEASVIRDEIQRLHDLPQPWHEGAHWDSVTYEVACQLIELANAEWSKLTLDEARSLVEASAPRDEAWDEWGAKFEAALRSVGDKAKPPPAERDTADAFSSAFVAQPSAVVTSAELGQLEDLESLERNVSGEGSGALSDAKLSKRFAHDVLVGRAVHLGRRHGWRRWNGKCWEPVEESAIVGLAREYFIAWHTQAAERGASLDILKALTSRLSAAKLEAVVRLSKADVPADVAEFDAHPDLLNVHNGIVDLRTGELLPHDPGMRLTKITPTKYVPGATHPDWTAALAAVPADCLDWFEHRCGQGVTGHAATDDKAVITVGGGSDGKTVIYGSILAAIGQHGVQLSDRVLTGKPGDHPTELAETEGARFALLEELPAGPLNVKRVKDMVGTPTIKARRMYEDSRGFASTLSLFVTTNHLPQVAETDNGTWRRLLHMPMPYRYVLPPEPLSGSDRRADEDLRARMLRGSSGQHEAVLAWLVAGARHFYEADHRMTPAPTALIEATAMWRRAEDRVYGFLDACCALAPARYVHGEELWQVYRDYAAAQGRHAGTSQEFTKRLEEHDLIAKNGVTKRKKLAADHGLSTLRLGAPTGSFNAWFGLAFKDESQASDAKIPSCWGWWCLSWRCRG